MQNHMSEVNTHFIIFVGIPFFLFCLGDISGQISNTIKD